MFAASLWWQYKIHFPTWMTWEDLRCIAPHVWTISSLEYLLTHICTLKLSYLSCLFWTLRAKSSVQKEETSFFKDFPFGRCSLYLGNSHYPQLKFTVCHSIVSPLFQTKDWHFFCLHYVSVTHSKFVCLCILFSQSNQIQYNIILYNIQI